MFHRPVLRWPAEAGALYTVVMVDEGIERLQGRQFIHWMVENVPSNMVLPSSPSLLHFPEFPSPPSFTLLP